MRVVANLKERPVVTPSFEWCGSKSVGLEARRHCQAISLTRVSRFSCGSSEDIRLASSCEEPRTTSLTAVIVVEQMEDWNRSKLPLEFPMRADVH